LLGRQGDIFRAGGSYINYERLQGQIETPLQIIIQKKSGLDHLVFITEKETDFSKVVSSYADLNEIVTEKVLSWEPKVQATLQYTHAGKLKKVIDERVI